MSDKKLIEQAEDRSDEILAKLYGANEIQESHSKAKRREAALKSFEACQIDTFALFANLDHH